MRSKLSDWWRHDEEHPMEMTEGVGFDHDYLAPDLWKEYRDRPLYKNCQRAVSLHGAGDLFQGSFAGRRINFSRTDPGLVYTHLEFSELDEALLLVAATNNGNFEIWSLATLMKMYVRVFLINNSARRNTILFFTDIRVRLILGQPCTSSVCSQWTIRVQKIEFTSGPWMKIPWQLHICLTSDASQAQASETATR